MSKIMRMLNELRLTKHGLRVLLVFSLFSGLLLLGNATAAHAERPKYLFKIGSLAPEGSIWAKRFREFAAEVTAKSNNEIVFKIYSGGVMGDDRAMLRKMRVGQLHGGGFTMIGISEEVNDFRVLGIPFLFKSYAEVDRVAEKLRPRLEKDFAAKNLELLAMSEVGFIYTMSTFPITTMEDFRKSKCWAPEGDPISTTLLQIAGASPTPLTIPDVLTSLQTGLIDTTFNSFYGSIVLQWFTRAKYVTDVPFVYAYGAFVIDKKTFSRLPPEYAELMRTTARKYFALLLEDTRTSNKEAQQVLADNGITFLSATPPAQAELHTLREKTVERLIGTAFSKEIYEATTQYLTEFRKEQEGVH